MAAVSVIAVCFSAVIALRSNSCTAATSTSAAVDSGTLDPDTLYVTGDADRFASWQAQYGDKADYITWDIAATGIYDRRDEYYFMAPKQ